MSNPDAGSAQISPDDWERIARYVTGEAGSGEAEITKRWVEAVGSPGTELEFAL